MMIYKLKPIFLEKIWGGQKLKSTYSSELSNIGEVWGVSAHRSNANMIQHSNKTLRDLYHNERHLFGNYPSEEFPILMKIIDAKEDLSVQVHPDNAYAHTFHSLGKEECWYILDASEDAEILIGHQSNHKDALIEAIQNNETMQVLKKYPIKKGDYFYIPAGTVHAILKNTVVLEVSQSSDIAYRLYDYNRIDQKGQTRDLHVKEALDVINIPDNRVIRNHIDKFFTFKVNKNTHTSSCVAHKYGDYIGIIKGHGYINEQSVKFGDFYMISSRDHYEIKGELEYVKVTLI
mgnify:FL=1